MRWQKPYPQVWARDSRSGELIFLEDGRAEEWRDKARAGFVVCPYPECSTPRFGVRSCTSRRDHFYHLDLDDRDSDSEHADESIQHLLAKEVIRRWAVDNGRAATVEHKVGDAVADLWVSGPRGGVAFEIQYSPLTVTDWEDRDARYASRGIEVVWLLGHVGDLAPCASDSRITVLTPVQRAVAKTSGRLLWIDPHRCQLLAPDWRTKTLRGRALASLQLPSAAVAVGISRQIVGLEGVRCAAPTDWKEEAQARAVGRSTDPLTVFRQSEPERYAAWIAGRERVRKAEQSGVLKRGRL